MENKKETAQERLPQEQLEINNGSKTINQVRKEYNLEPIKSGDALYYKIIL